MYIHKEGYKITGFTILTVIICLGIMVNYIEFWNWFWYSLVGGILVFAFLIIRFFRIPKREILPSPNQILAPADGTIVVVERVFEGEYLMCECIQISTFMSPNNVHVNRYPTNGKIIYANYHNGKYLIAKNPKSSTLNERTSVCLETEDGKKIMIRQIAGALARRIVCYAKEGQEVLQGEELGFIKFGSRVDLFIPLDANVRVKLEDKVKGGVSVIATL